MISLSESEILKLKEMLTYVSTQGWTSTFSKLTSRMESLDTIEKILQGNKFTKEVQVMQLTLQTEHEVKNWVGSSLVASPVLEPTEDNPSGVYWQMNGDTCIPNDYVVYEEGDFRFVPKQIFEAHYRKV